MRDDGLREQTIYQRLSILRLLDRTITEELTPASLLRFVRDRGLSPGTSYQYHSICSSFFCWALATNLIEFDPFERGRRPAKPRYKARPAGTRDMLEVFAKAREPERSWAILAAYAGLRCGEIARVSGRDLVPAGDGWVLRVPEGKGSKPGSVPAHPRVVELLRDHESGRIWPTMSAQKVSQRANAEFRRIGAKCRMHELRHAFATELYKQTRDVLTVQHALRHEQLETTARYIAFDDDAVSSAISGLAFG
jgi:integrase/recombinase XerC